MSTDAPSDGIEPGAPPVGSARTANPMAGATLDQVTILSPSSPGPPTNLPPPDSFPGYEIVRELHRGGQGIVYVAIQKSTHRKVAVKVMREGPFAGASDRGRFEREVQILGQLQHPNIVTIHDSGEAGGCQFFVMDYISGEPLDAYFAARRPADASRRGAYDELLGLCAQICDAVHVAHLRGVVHRDLKPGNIRVDEGGQPHILDFGLAKAASLATAGTAMTETGEFVGSLPWAAPEQAEGKPGKIDVRTDVYALGVVLFQMLTGRFPYDVVGPLREVLDRIISAVPLNPRSAVPALDSDLVTIVLKCLHKERERRYQSAGDLARDIRHYLAGEPIEARRDSAAYVLRKRTTVVVQRHPWVAGAAVAALATVAAMLVGVPLIYNWTPANRLFERLAYAGMAPLPLEHVRVVTLTDQTDLPGLADRLHIDPQCLSRDHRCLRRFHAALLERLASVGATVAVFNSVFGGQTEYDTEVVGGIQALQAAHGQVVIATRTWSVPTDSPAGVSPAIAGAARWGCSPSLLGPTASWRLPLAVKRPGDSLPSLALAAYAAFRRPEYRASVQFSGRDDASLNLIYWRPAARDPLERVGAGEDVAIPYSTSDSAREDVREFDIHRGDELGIYLLNMPPDALLQRVTLDYQRVFTADPGELRELLAGKVVVVGDHRDGQGMFATPDDRRIAGTYAHAVGIEMLLRDAPIRIPPQLQTVLLTGVGAVLGVLAGWVLARRHGVRGAALVAGSGLIVVLGLWSAWHAQLLYNPLVAVVSFVLGSELAAVASRTWRARHT